jgi:predicted ester cyclase
MADSNKDVLRRIGDEVVNGRDLAAADTLFSRDYVYHGPGGLELHGPDGFKQMIGVYQQAFPDFHIVIEDMIEEGDKVAFRLTTRGTHSGDLGGIAPTGRHVAVTTIIISRFAGGKCVEEWQSVDEVDLLRQLGVTALPAAAHT